MAIVSTVVAFAIWLISRVILALYIAIGPLLIGRVEVLLAGVIFFGLAGFVAFQLPGVASSLSGGRFCRKPIASIDDAQAPRS